MDVADPLEKNANRQGGISVSAEENMALPRRFMEARIKGDLDAVDEMMASDYVSHTKLLPGQEPGREGEKMGACLTLCRRLRHQLHHRGSGTRGRQGGEPLHRAGHPRSRGAYGCCPYRQRDD